MHAVARNGPLLGLVLMLILVVPLVHAVTAEVGVGATETTGATAPIAIGDPVPALSLPSLRHGGEPVRLSDYRGKILYLDFWSSWCAPCRRAMPHLDTLRREFDREDFEVIGISVDPVADDARRFLDQVPVSYPVVTDAGGVAARRFGVEVLPALIVVDGAGVVREAVRGSGVEARDDLRGLLARLIEEREVR